MPYPSVVARSGRDGHTEDPHLPQRASRRSIDPAETPLRPASSGPDHGRDPSDPSDLPDPSEAAPPDLSAAEELIASLRGIGATMFLTTERLIVTRDGLERRPRSGVQTFPLERITHIRLEPGAPPSGRIAIRIGGQEAVSMFFDARSRDRAQEAVDRARALIAQRRRERQAARRTTG